MKTNNIIELMSNNLSCWAPKFFPEITDTKSETPSKKKLYLSGTRPDSLLTPMLQNFVNQLRLDIKHTKNFTNIIDELFKKNQTNKNDLSDTNIEGSILNITYLCLLTQLYDNSFNDLLSKMSHYQKNRSVRSSKESSELCINNFRNFVREQYQLVKDFCALFDSNSDRISSKQPTESFSIDDPDIKKVFAIYSQFVPAIIIEKEKQLAEIDRIKNLISQTHNIVIDTNIFQGNYNSITILELPKLLNQPSNSIC